MNYNKMDEETKWREAGQLRKLVFAAVTVSTVAIFLCVVSVPMLYNYMQTVQSKLRLEVDFCKSRSGSLWQVSNSDDFNFCDDLLFVPSKRSL